ncbi:S-layer homology domain-containing protein [Tissierella praeacuta DSM 18095]|uniref:S-layer homology domain-containing protein n=1 Tax=Tissierella praeacuta DSM 18095 TaxID=1123404 RepID=A0A1M4XVN4_9FIRM|nr:S-layer homology domain-containing protein [Tissierella praeacuta]SHE97353.1 S-layer homology domain-containing protein [Tissierella praeacuta DSM 18095]SUO99220.1 Hexagonal wall protein [Tissierella praeacuta]
MNKMKRIFSFLLVLSMILGSFGSVFTTANAAAAEKADKELTKVPKDVVGTEYEKAISRLVAFGIIEGYPDGTFKPEKEVTRAEFAKILIEALGIGNATKAATGVTKFSDVPASHWASGYINVASGQGLIKGYNNGTFQPEKKVSYAEALTMLVRALGYQDDFLKGTWPGNYVAKAAEAGITAGVKFDSAVSAANRGDVANLVNNTLDGNIVKVDIYKGGTVEYKETEKTLLKDRLNISKYEDARVIADKIVDDGLEANEITVKFLKEIDKNDESVKKSYKKNEEKDFKFKKVVNPRKYIGEEVTVYMNDNEEVVYIEVENDDKAYFDYVFAASGKDREVDKLELVKFDKEYSFDSDAKVYVFDSKDDKYVELSVKKDGIDTKLSSVVGHVGKFVVKNNRIVYAEIMDSSEALPWMLVRENKSGVLKGINQTTENFDVDLTKKANYDGVFVFDTLGNKLDVEDIKEGNIVYVQKQEYDGDDYAVVVVVKDNIVEGKLSKVKDDRVTLGDKQVKAIKYSLEGSQFQTFYSVDGFEDVKEWTGKDGDWTTDMEDADGEEMTAYLDAVGKIAFLTTKTNGSSGYKYGIVTKAYADNDRIKIYTYVDGKEGKEITYKVEKERNLNEPVKLDEYGQVIKGEKRGKVEAGDVVKFKLNKNGDIAENEFYAATPKNTWKMRKDKDFGKDSIPSTLYENENEHKSFVIDDKAIIIDAEGLKHNSNRTGFNSNFDVDDFGTANWKNMAENKYDKDLEYFVFTKRNNKIDVDAIIFIGKGASTSSDVEAIYVTDIWTKGGDVHIKYVSYETGKVEEKEVEKLDGSNIKYSKSYKERPFIAKVKSSGKIDLYDEDKDDLIYVKGIVDKKDGNVITVGKDDYKLSSSAVVYEEGTKKTASNIRKGDAVFFIAENKVNIRVIERLVGSEADKVKKDGGTTKPQDPEKGVVTYINKDRIFIDDEKYTLNADTVLYNKDGKFILAVGGEKIGEHLKQNAVVKDVKTNKDGVITSFVLVKESTEAEADRNAAKAVDNKIEALKIVNDKAPTEDEKTAIKAARKAYEDLTKAQKALVKNLADLVKLEAIVEKTEGPVKAEKEAIEAVVVAVALDSKTKLAAALNNELFKKVEEANMEAYLNSAEFEALTVDSKASDVNSAIDKVNNDVSGETEEIKAVSAVISAVALNSKSKLATALDNKLFNNVKEANMEAYLKSAEFKALKVNSKASDVNDAIDKVNDDVVKEADKKAVEAAKALITAKSPIEELKVEGGALAEAGVKEAAVEEYVKALVSGEVAVKVTSLTEYDVVITKGEATDTVKVTVTQFTAK